jgi:hypothetical protein
MDALNFFVSLWEWFTSEFPSILGAVTILIIGWIIALILATVIRKAFSHTGIGDRFARWMKGDEDASGVEVNKWSGRIVFYLAMFFVLVAFFQQVGLTYVAEPLNAFLTQLFQYAPNILGALVLALLAWLLATLLRAVVVRILQAAKIDERFTEDVGEEEKKVSLSQTLGNTVYWIIFLLFLPAILSTLRIEGLLIPVQSMLETILSYLPNIIGASLVIIVGWFAAKLLKRFVVNLLSGLGVDRVSERPDLSGYFSTTKPSEFIGQLIYALVIIFVIIGALNALNVEAITGPASSMLEMILNALPAIFAAGLILLLAYLVGRILTGLISGLLSSAGFDQFLVKLGIAKSVIEGQKTPSEIVGYLALVAIMLFASIEAAGLLGFNVLSELIAQLTVLLGKVIVSVVIFGIGLYLANLAKEVVESSGGPQSELLAKLARIAILILAGAIALRQLGVADEIIVIAFGVLVGSIALTGVIAFGLGGRDLASRELSEWIDKIKNK